MLKGKVFTVHMRERIARGIAADREGREARGAEDEGREDWTLPADWTWPGLSEREVE